MKKMTIAAALLAVALPMAACSVDQDETAGEATATAPMTTYTTVEDTVVEPDEGATVAAEPPLLKDTFITGLDYLGIPYTNADDAFLGGMVVCQFIEEGNSVGDLFVEMAVNPYADQILPPVTNAVLPEFMGAAVATLCPEYQVRVNADLARFE